MPTLVSVFDFPDDAATAIKKLRGRGFDELESYSPFARSVCDVL